MGTVWANVPLTRRQALLSHFDWGNASHTSSSGWHFHFQFPRYLIAQS